MSVEMSGAQMSCRRFQAIVQMLAVKDSAVGTDYARFFSESVAVGLGLGVAGDAVKLRVRRTHIIRFLHNLT